jgi:alpha-ketoglutarate-dependent 2,4-dichlorophenoxyacetate dioxygenase
MPITITPLHPFFCAEIGGVDTGEAMVRENPVTHRKSIYAGAHCSHVIGWPREEGRDFIAWLNDFATRPQFCYSHPWAPGDLVIWDNRSVLHRATAYDTQNHQRLMQRTTVGGDRETTLQPARYELAAE